MISRRGFFAAGAAAASGCMSPAGAGSAVSCAAKPFVLGPRNGLLVPCAALKAPVRIAVIGDTHFCFRDARDDAHADGCRRMERWPAPKDALAKALKRAREENVDLVALVGDNISFPTFANVEHLKKELDGCGLPWMFVAGNHDWHFEGVPGSDAAQRAEWAPKRLAPLYQGADPLMASRVVKGVRCVMLDNSVYHVTPGQLAFWKAEAAKGDPVALFMHVPFWVEGWGLHTCGCPTWGAATDPYWEIERREHWAERQSPESFALREAVLATPNLVGVFTGHIHRLMVAQLGGQLMVSVPSNRDGSSVVVTVGGTELV